MVDVTVPCVWYDYPTWIGCACGKTFWKDQMITVGPIRVSLHSLDKDAITFFEKAGHALTVNGKAFGWAGHMGENYFWKLVRSAYEKGFAVKLTRGTVAASDENGNLDLIILQLDSNKWKFKQH